MPSSSLISTRSSATSGRPSTCWHVTTFALLMEPKISDPLGGGGAAATLVNLTATAGMLFAVGIGLVDLATPPPRTARGAGGGVRGKQRGALVCASTHTDHHVPGRDARAHVANRQACRRAVDDVRAEHEWHLRGDLLPGVLIAERHRNAAGFDAVLQDHGRLAGGI